jgi:hypothetical protein
MATERNIVHPPALQAGKAATKALIRAAGGQEEAAPLTGRSQPRLSSYCGPNTDAFIPVDAVAALEAVTHGHPGHPHVTRWLAREAGYALLPLSRFRSAATGELHRAVGRVAKEANDVVATTCEALADGKLDKAESRRKRIIPNIDEAIDRLCELRCLVVEIEEGA